MYQILLHSVVQTVLKIFVIKLKRLRKNCDHYQWKALLIKTTRNTFVGWIFSFISLRLVQCLGLFSQIHILIALGQYLYVCFFLYICAFLFLFFKLQCWRDLIIKEESTVMIENHFKPIYTRIHRQSEYSFSLFLSLSLFSFEKIDFYLIVYLTGRSLNCCICNFLFKRIDTRCQNVRTYFLRTSSKSTRKWQSYTENPGTVLLNLLATWIYANDSYQLIWTFEDKWFVFIYKFAETFPQSPFGVLCVRASVCSVHSSPRSTADGSSV